MAAEQLAPAVDLSWASPALREQLERDPAAVLKDRGLNVPDDVPLAALHEFARIMLLLWVDGRIVPVDQFYIDPADEGLLFGRGAWESTRTINGVPWLWPLHVDRLRQTMQLLALPVAPERLPDGNQVREYVRALSGQDVVIRLNVSAGRPGKSGMVWMSAALQPYPISSVRLRTCPNPVQKGQAYLTLKTFQYATRLRIGQQVAQDGFDTALLLDAEGNLQEASHANIFVRMPEGWATPTADGGFLPGTVRAFLLQKSPLPIRERTIPSSLLAQVQEVFVTNSNVGIIPVTQIDQLNLPIGPDTKYLMSWIEPAPAPGVQYRFRKSLEPIR